MPMGPEHACDLSWIGKVLGGKESLVMLWDAKVPIALRCYRDGLNAGKLVVCFHLFMEI